MNFDKLQEQWNKEEVSAPEISLEHQDKLNNPLQKIRRNMKMEFWMSILTIIPILLWINFSVDNPKVRIYASMLIISMILVSVFYFKVFYKTYQSISNNTLNTLDSLKDSLFQLKLYEQYYISYYLSFVPFLVCEMIIIYEFMPVFKTTNSYFLVFNFVIMLLFGLMLLYLFGKFWFNEFYGKYINQVSMLISEITGVEGNNNFGSNIFKTNNKNTFISKTEPFFTKYFGGNGSFINVIFWIIIIVLGLLITSFVVGFIIGYLGLALK